MISGYSTYNKTCEKQGNSYCTFYGFKNMSGDTVFRCRFCNKTHIPSKPVVPLSFQDFINEVMRAKKEGREPRIKKRVEIKF